MEAVIVDLKDFGNRTPEQAVRVFLRMYGKGKTRIELFALFRAMAAHGMMDQTDAPMDVDRISLLFDQLIALADAVEKLVEGESTDPRCVVCGAARDKNS